MISNAIKTAFKKKEDRGWEKIYWAIDVHDCILSGKYSSDQEYDPPQDAIDVLKILSDDPTHVIIIWTSSYAKDYDRLKKWFKDNHGINFDYHNENPECGNTDYAEFTTKFYFNVLLDDKSGFMIESDWKIVKDTLLELNQGKPIFGIGNLGGELAGAV